MAALLRHSDKSGLRGARAAWEREGTGGLDHFLAQLKDVTGADYALTDGSGRDLCRALSDPARIGFGKNEMGSEPGAKGVLLQRLAHELGHGACGRVDEGAGVFD